MDGTGSTEFELGTDGPRAILVGIDGSDTSVRAGAYAAGLARRQGSRLIVLFVTTTPPFSGMAPAVADAAAVSREEEVAAMRRLAAEGASYTGVEIDFRSAHGDPFTEITRVAEDERADAIVVGASTSPGHRLAGSLAVRLVKAGRWPVTVVP